MISIKTSLGWIQSCQKNTIFYLNLLYRFYQQIIEYCTYVKELQINILSRKCIRNNFYLQISVYNREVSNQSHRFYRFVSTEAQKIIGYKGYKSLHKYCDQV